jgi:hypothetical protein
MAYNGEMFPLDFQPLVMYQSIKEINDLKYFGNYYRKYLFFIVDSFTQTQFYL